MHKNILVFSNGEKIGDGLIKLPFLNEIKRRFPDSKIYWMTNKNSTVYNNQLKNIANQFIYEIFEKAELNLFFWQKISNKYNLNNLHFDYIIDTQKAVFRTICLKRIKCSMFVSDSANSIFSNYKKINKNLNKERKYYLEDLYDLLDLIKKDKVNKNYKISIPKNLEKSLDKIFDKKNSYIGIAPGAGEKNKIWLLKNFIEIGKYFEKKLFKLVFFIGPQEQDIKEKLIHIFPNAIIPEDIIKNFSGPEIVMGSTKYLSCALSNDSGVSHMLSTNFCHLIKLFGPKDSKKFTPISDYIHTISSKEFGSNNINEINTDYVINKMNNIIKLYSKNNV